MPKTRFGVLAILFLTLLLSGCSPLPDDSPEGIRRQDISTIRQAFQLPETSEPSYYQASPDMNGWYGREGLKILVTFPLNPETYRKYADEDRKSKDWYPLPASQVLAFKSRGLEATFNTLGISAQKLQNPPKRNKDAYYENWLKQQQPLNIRQGSYKCLTAGNSIMHDSSAYPRVSCFEKPGTLNDFMLAVLDGEHHRLHVIIHSEY
jgi:hypothetical protein